MAMRCPACGGSKFDAARAVVGGSGPVRYSLAGGISARLVPGLSALAVKARACLSCGYLVLTVEPEKLRELAGRAGFHPSDERVGKSEQALAAMEASRPGGESADVLEQMDRSDEEDERRRLAALEQMRSEAERGEEGDEGGADQRSEDAE